ncbi:MAG: MOSC domain-containing protein [Acidobacteriota bacterium]
MKFKIESVNISEKKGVQKHPVDVINLIESYGIEGDAHAGKWHRQISFLAGEAIDSMRERAGDFKINYGDFAENIVTRGINWKDVKVGGMIHINDVVMEITQIGKECHSGCAILAAVGDCIMPREGIFAKVIKGGKISAENSGHYSI